MARPAEASEVHTRLLKCALEVDEARAYWAHTDGGRPVRPQEAFESYWFGAKSLPRVEVLLTNLRARFDAFPTALQALHRWPGMAPDTRRLVCHWHLQLADPLYRRFTGAYLPARLAGPKPDVSRHQVVEWVSAQGPGRWTMPTRLQFASKLLSSAYAAGLLGRARDPRPIKVPRVPDEALVYLMYLLREVQIEGALLENPYLISVGLQGDLLQARLRSAPGLALERQGDLVSLTFTHPDLATWAATLTAEAAS